MMDVGDSLPAGGDGSLQAEEHVHRLCQVRASELLKLARSLSPDEANSLPEQMMQLYEQQDALIHRLLARARRDNALLKAAPETPGCRFAPRNSTPLTRAPALGASEAKRGRIFSAKQMASVVLNKASC